MKILFLNPQIDAQHGIVQALKARGMAVLLPANSTEAWQVLKLHGTSVDLAIIHREGVKGGDPGVELLYKIKKDPSQFDLPIIFTSETWSSQECASHQQTPMGANAYLHWPFEKADLLKMVDAVFGQDTKVTGELHRVSPPKAGEFVLEDPSGIFNSTKSDTSIKLEAPHGAEKVEVSGTNDSGSLSIDLMQPEGGTIEAALSKGSALSSLPKDSALSALLEMPMSVEDSDHIQTAGQSDQSVAQPSSMMDIPSMDDSSKIGKIDESELKREMPYLFSKGESSSRARGFSHPVGDAVVPGGAAHSPDTETLKKYLLLREQDVAALSAQLKAARDELQSAKDDLSSERKQADELHSSLIDRDRKIDDFEREKALALDGLHVELAELRFQHKAKADKAKLLENQVNEAAVEIDRLKERVRSDIRKIRVRERELENKLEINKKDSEAIMNSRENKIIELKRKLDLLEFNMDILQDRYNREKENSTKLREKLAKAVQVVRVAEGLLDEPNGASGTEESKAS